MSADRGGAGTDRSWDVLARAAAAREAGETPGFQCELLGFRLGGDPYAAPIERVREIVRLRPITPVPRVPAPVLGVISLRGEIVQVLDLRLRLSLAAGEPSRDARIIVVHGSDGEVSGVLVDRVEQVLRVPEEAILPAPAGESEFVSALCRRDGAFVSIMNLDRVLDLAG